MKTVKREKGDWGEDKACNNLLNRGYKIIDRNFSCKIGELDIVAVKDKCICFIEVKTRNSVEYGLPCEAVDAHKRRNIIYTSEYYMRQNKWSYELQPRYDIFEILTLDNGVYFRHLEGAFDISLMR